MILFLGAKWASPSRMSICILMVSGLARRCIGGDSLVRLVPGCATSRGHWRGSLPELWRGGSSGDTIRNSRRPRGLFGHLRGPKLVRMDEVYRHQPGVQVVDAMSVSVPRAETVTPTEPVDGTPLIPPLQEGDRLMRDEFAAGVTMRCRISRKPIWIRGRH